MDWVFHSLDYLYDIHCKLKVAEKMYETGITREGEGMGTRSYINTGHG
jgi:hypothetical protein